VVDNGNFRVQKFDTESNFILAFGQQGNGEGEFTRPIYVVTDQEGSVYTTDDENPWVQKFDSDGNFITRWGGEGTGDGQFTHVTGITIDAAGNIFVADFEGNRIQKFDSDGTFILGWGGTASSEPGQLRGPNALASDAAGRIYEVDRMNHRVQVFDNDGNFLLTWGSFGRGDEDLQFPSGIAVGPNGRVYVGDEGNDRIQVYEIDWHDGSMQTAVLMPTPPPTVYVPTLTFTTADGVNLSGTVYGVGTTAVIFSTMGEHHQDTWANMAQIVADQGYLAFTYDFRFWQPDGTIDDDLRDYADDDLQAAIATMREQGAEQIVLVGASLGGMASLVLADEVAPTAVVILAAPLNESFFPTLHTTAADVQAITAPILFIGSEDEDFAPDLQQMFELANEPKELELYPGSAHGTELFDTANGTAVTERILNFIQTYAPTKTTAETTAPHPPLSLGHELVYDEQQQMVLLINSGMVPNETITTPSELWGWDGTQWQLLDSDGPPARNLAAVAYDTNRDLLVLYGGQQNGTTKFDDTWIWDGQSWTELDIPGPAARDHIAMAYDAERDQAVFVSGVLLSNDLITGTWAFDGDSWQQLSETEPSPRAHYAITYDGARQQLLLFGGVSDADMGDTWVWDGVWIQVATTSGPTPRNAMRLAYDPTTEQVVLFGGRSGNIFLDDTWVWDGTQWTELDVTGPSARGLHAMAYDAARSRLVLFGGYNGTENLNDTWEWDGTQWRCVDGCNS
jgi:DNA-binding beta-propeller fold protein YncE/dienelactone hydrolase